MIIEIGSKPLKELSADELKQIIIIEGSCPGLQYWNEPKIIDFNNTMFSDTHYVDFVSYRTSDLVKSSDYTFFFNFKKFSFHYTRDFEQNQNQKINSKRVGLETIRYLLSKGYDVPIYNNA